MRKQYRSFLLASLVPAFLLVSVFAVVQAQNAGSPAVKQRAGLILPPGLTRRCPPKTTRSPLKRT